MKHKPNPSHIAGIYNYCDRWCERCAFTSRCAVYEGNADVTPEQNDSNNKAFWSKLSQNFTDAIILIQKAAKEQGITIEPLSDAEWEEYKAAKKAGRDKAKEHPLIKNCSAYLLQAKALLDKNNLLQQTGEEIIRHTQLGITNVEDAKQNVEALANCLEVVQWYLFQIQVKFMRAMPMMPDDDGDESFINDSNGSAKVALTGVDRSIMAWQKILQALPHEEDAILPLLALLQKILVLGEKTFPHARQFIRPGLDE
jgi:hypothetical protein